MSRHHRRTPRLQIYIVMEHCEGGDLAALIRRCKNDSTALPEEFVWQVLAQVTVALRECHRHRDATGALRPILHRDIKPGASLAVA